MRASLAVLRGMPWRGVGWPCWETCWSWGRSGRREHAGLAADVADAADLLYACGPLMRHLFEAMPESKAGCAGGRFG